MIRILHVIGTLANGGVESFILNSYRHIDTTEIQFDFVVGSRECWSYAYENEIKSRGGRIIFFPTTPIGFLRYYRFLKRNHYKVVHSHREAMSALFLLVAKWANVPVRISHSHMGTFIGGITRKIGTVFLKPLLYNVTTKRLACGKEAGVYLYGNRSFEIVKNGIDVEKFCYRASWRLKKRKELALSEKDKVFIHVGRFEQQKNHDFLINVFYEIYLRDNTAKIILIGNGSLRNNIEKKINNLGLSSSIIILEQRADVNELLSAADVVIFPSFTEGFSLAMVEMQAAGLPILCSDTIPHEIKLTPLVHFNSIEVSPKQWANEAILLSEQMRVDFCSELKKAGLDIHESVKSLTRIYKSNA